MRIGIMATYPGRLRTAPIAIRSIYGQLDKLIVILNEFDSTPNEYPQFAQIEYRVPEQDLKDVAKFSVQLNSSDVVFTLDDDIIYPSTYVKTLLKHHALIGLDSVGLGLHGTTYESVGSDIFGSRRTRTFHRKLREFQVVDQLGTGLMMLRASDLPGLDIMGSAQNFVDIRFAAYAADRGIPLIVVPRPIHWARPLPTETSIYEDFTLKLPDTVRQEIISFAGVRTRHKAAQARIAQLNRFISTLVYARLTVEKTWSQLAARWSD